MFERNRRVSAMSNNDNITLVLTGAGASFGCEHIYPKQPPVSDQLYDELASSFPYSWGSIAGEKFRQNFEAGMYEIWQQRSTIVPQLMREMAIYFSQFHSDGSFSDLYSQFLKHIVSNDMEEQIVLSTINYECILELAACNLGFKIDYFTDTQSSKEKVILWKLHGSCNFIPKGISATKGVIYTAGVQFGAGIEPIQPNQVPMFCTSNTALYPAMSIFTQGKPMQICSQIIQRLQGYWASRVTRAGKVVIIGVNPNPNDSHIWNPLANTDAKILYIGNKERFENWISQFRPTKNSLWLADKFRDGFNYLIESI